MRGRIHIREKNGHETSRNGENEKRKAEVQVGFQEYKQNKINRKEKMLF